MGETLKKTTSEAAEIILRFHSTRGEAGRTERKEQGAPFTSYEGTHCPPTEPMSMAALPR